MHKLHTWSEAIQGSRNFLPPCIISSVYHLHPDQLLRPCPDIVHRTDPCHLIAGLGLLGDALRADICLTAEYHIFCCGMLDNTNNFRYRGV